MPRIVVHHGSGFISRAIQIRDREWANHISIELTPGDKLIEALAKGVKQVRTLREVVESGKEQVRVFDLPPTTVELEEFAATMLRCQLGKHYDFLGIVGFVLPWHKIRGKSESWFCSELGKAYCDWRGTPIVGQVATPLASLGVYVEPHLCDPGDVMQSTELHEVALTSAIPDPRPGT